MFKFLHTADLHLDSPLVGLIRYPGAPVEQLRNATRQALENLVDFAITEQVAFVLIAGDLYDGDWKDYHTGLFFVSQMLKLREAGVKVFIVAGNHDSASNLTKRLRMPENVKMFSDKKPETEILQDLGVAIHGQSYRSRVVTEDLSANYPQRLSGLFNIGLLHTSLDGRPGHEPYSPCSLDALISKGYDYWALGHVHKRELINEKPLILFPGNIQGRYIRETGPKGCTLVTVQDGRVLFADHKNLDVLRWSLCEVDSSGADSCHSIVNHVLSTLEGELARCDDLPLAVRIRIHGPCRAHGEISRDIDKWTNEIRAAANDLSGGKIWVEKILFQTQAIADLNEMLARDDAFGSLLRGIQDLSTNEELLSKIATEFRDLYYKLPPEVREGDDAIDLAAPKTFSCAIEEVKQLLITRLLFRAGEAQ
ncbi:MAG: DNA repair exonuclease [Mesotoga sp.]|nr:DNA repair exonuclease [Mesotoga sp.]